ncbi:MAG: signal peptidase I [Spirochaetes bacterium]|jgi:signal peptidase I|nr:signal peptidase I [Spirochaetota bacterium]
MIQFLRFDKTKIEGAEFNMVRGSAAARYFLRNGLYFILFIYSTIFLAVAIPFVRTPFIPIYFIGGMATSLLAIRIVNSIIKYRSYKNGRIKVSPSAVEIISDNVSISVPSEKITYLEVNFLGNLLIRQKEIKTSFPLLLLEEQDRSALISIFEDMAPRRTSIYRRIWEFIDAITVALVLAVHIIQYIVQAYFIPTGSMEDTLRVGDHLFVEKITYGPIIPKMIFMKKPVHLSFMGIRKIQKGDIVIFRPPHEQDKDYIKRCIAVPGDRFEIKEGAVYINGKRQEEPYVKGITSYYNFGIRKSNEIEGVVPAGKVIVLGDNRENSQDSRYFGYLELERIKGKAFILYWNTRQLFQLDFSRLGLIK